MKYYLAYRFTGEDPKVLKKNMSFICNLLTKNGHNNYCSFFDPSMVDIGNKNVILKAFQEIDKSDALLVFINSEKKSEGMLMEVGYAFSQKKRIVLLIKKGIKGTTYIDDLSDKVIEFDTLEELKKLDLE